MKYKSYQQFKTGLRWESYINVTIESDKSISHSFDSLIPAAGSFNSTELTVAGNEGFAIILHSRQNVIICGLSVFLPHGKGIFYFRFSAYCGEKT